MCKCSERWQTLCSLLLSELLEGADADYAGEVLRNFTEAELKELGFSVEE